MGMGRQKALDRIRGLLARVEGHMEKLTATPSLYDDQHWRHEMRNWLEQMEAVLPHVGKKTSAYWQEIFEDLRRKAGQRDNSSREA